jgi:predicted nucleotidyltransferase
VPKVSARLSGQFHAIFGQPCSDRGYGRAGQLRDALSDKDADQVGRIASVARGVLGRSVIGLYLHGSAVMGGLRPTSDLDVLAVIDRPTTRLQRARLISGLMPISGSPDPESRWRPVELTVAARADVMPWRFPPRMEFQYGEWLRGDYESGVVPQPGPNPDLAALITVVLMGNRSLLGPPPAEVLDPVPAQDLRRAIIAGVPGLMADLEPDTRNVLLTFARIWHTAETGEIVSKDRAAEWAAERLAPADAEIVRLAAAHYLAGTHGENEWPARSAAVRSSAAAMLSAIEKAR